LNPDVLEALAASGRYYNTGKVLVGLQYSKLLPALSRDEELVQAGLLGIPKKRPLVTFFLCLVYGLAVFAAGSCVAKLLP
jgi:hypothetical protein